MQTSSSVPSEPSNLQAAQPVSMIPVPGANLSARGLIFQSVGVSPVAHALKYHNKFGFVLRSSRPAASRRLSIRPTIGKPLKLQYFSKSFNIKGTIWTGSRTSQNSLPQGILQGNLEAERGKRAFRGLFKHYIPVWSLQIKSARPWMTAKT
jgi:hypothetical protein